ncbi:nuclear transport factor 2 family protein [Xanthomonas maliensis]|uniref:nuclear transport factor 2 family protein n=1 Tax=Xanthomonas maliensis TaxID=1321368 RepID=UPI0003A8996E|nr:ketosteroid isomerase [Xanthomonas maliensis]
MQIFVLPRGWLASACALLLSLALPAAAAERDCGGDAAMPTAACNKQRVQAAFAGWAEGRGSFFDRVLSPEVVWTIEGSGPRAGTLRGREALVRQAVQPLAERLATPLRPLHWDVWADGDHVIVVWEGAARLRDGGEYRNRYAWILRMQAGRAVEVHAFLDLVRYSEVLDRAPAGASARATR